MKKLFLLFLVILTALSSFAQIPQNMSYQAVIRNSSNQLISNHIVGLRISILQGSATGTPVYVETQTPSTNINGLVTIEIGGGIPSIGTLAGIDWSTGTYFLKTETDPTGGANYTIIGTNQLLSVPYAMYAHTAGNGFSGNYYDLTNKPILFSGNYYDLTNLPLLFDGTWGSLTGKPILAAVSTSGNYNDLTNKPTLFNGSWANLSGKPTSLAGYGITDAMSTSHVANGITSTMIGNWNMAFSWGNPSGLYRPISYVPAWSEISSKPTTLAGYGITDAVNITDDQSIAGNKTFKGTISTSSHNITNVANPVNAQDAATKAYVDAMQTQITMLKNTLKAGGIVIDVDGNPYNTVVIGTQTWMAENLKTTKYNDGTPIPYVTDSTVWSSLSTPAYCWYNNDSSTYKATLYGALYNWYSINTGKLCPTGWQVPGGWSTLITYLGGQIIAGGELKENGTTHWLSPNTGATNASGFTALPCGYRSSAGTFGGIEYNGTWWSTLPYYTHGSEYATMAYMMLTQYNIQEAVDLPTDVKIGFSVRCVKNN